MSASSADPKGAAVGGGRPAAEGWGGALAKGVLAAATSFLGFVVIADGLTNFLATRVAPRTRDSLVLLWVAVFFIVMSWAFVRLQRPRET